MAAASSGGSGEHLAAAALDWRFGQVFGERTPGDEVQEGARCARRRPALIGPAASCTSAGAAAGLRRPARTLMARRRRRRARGARGTPLRAGGLPCGAKHGMLHALPERGTHRSAVG